MKTRAKPGVWRFVWDQLVILAGCLLVALGLDLFLVPNRITAGGVSGVATIFHYTFGFPVGLSMLAMNAALFFVAFWLLGKEFGVRSLGATIGLSVLVDAVALALPLLGVPPEVVAKGVTDNLLLATVFGDIITGVGMAMVFLKNASTGGTDILARLLNKYTELPMGRSLLIVDTAVTVGAGFVFGAEMAMFAIIAIYVNSQAIDTLIQGLQQGKKFLIVSDKVGEIAQDVLHEMGRGATFLNGVGAYTGDGRPILLVVVRRREFPRLKGIIRRHDPKAFVMVSDVYEILGEGFGRLA